MSKKLKEITDAQFQKEVIEANLPVLVDFWAPWCGPCKAMAPILENLAEEMADKLKIVKVDITTNQQFATANNVRSIPNFVLYKNGAKCEQFIGAKDKSELLKIINAALQ
ncbi:MAG: thioredoxin [Deltaproteobacteria bacterium]|jgi:thioredoxin 1|nr:thioredoxin [Deltaproteobacteria bacterium]